MENTKPKNTKLIAIIASVVVVVIVAIIAIVLVVKNSGSARSKVNKSYHNIFPHPHQFLVNSLAVWEFCSLSF